MRRDSSSAGNESIRLPTQEDTPRARWAASSSVGLVGIQVALAVGARPLALTHSSDKAPALRDTGAEVRDTAQEDLVARVRSLTGGTGARIAFDPVGGLQFADLATALASEGTIVFSARCPRRPRRCR